MKMIKKILIAEAVIFSFVATTLRGQTCDTLQGTTPAALVSHLNEVTDRRRDAPCIAYAIEQIGDQQYEPAIPTLTKFLEFRWPLGVNQKQRRFVIEHDGFTIYPAADALEKIGKDSLPAVLETMKANYTSREAMEVAVSVWMTIHKDEGVTGVTLLKQEADNSTDRMVRARLGFAAFRAPTGWCTESERPQCEAAAQKRYPVSRGTQSKPKTKDFG